MSNQSESGDFETDEQIFVKCSPVEGCLFPEFEKFHDCSDDSCYWIVIQRYTAKGVWKALKVGRRPEQFRDVFSDVSPEIYRNLKEKFKAESKPTTYAHSAGYFAGLKVIENRGREFTDTSVQDAAFFESKELRDDLREAMGQLSDRQKEVFLLYSRYDDLSKACEENGLSYSTLSKEFGAMKKILKKHLRGLG